ncbi:hypothetical protein FEM48_Zijuj03G0100100 [Ziziphus jujuba var. spinosa]|uniref:ARM repeat superfamily protein n=1 Tax=Ziziphus jujuba var. spinosa TaxID=714518 RepID=A0A978VPN1_ZIZJJ|nr:hypothetical protein FEM48_Zijuj03G0100100 [Ziziphus jujuba var. spinosa]
MSDSLSTIYHLIVQLSESLRESLLKTPYTPPEGSNFSVKSVLQPLLLHKPSPQNPNFGGDDDDQIRSSIINFSLACALISSSQSSTHDLLSWIPKHLSAAADSAFRQLSVAYSVSCGERSKKKIGELGINFGLLPDEKRLVVELVPEVLPLLKDAIKQSSIDKSDECNEFSAATARMPVGFAMVAANQFRWFVTQIDYPHLGKLCALVIPCGLTALDHWSPEVKGQGMISFIHIGKNVNAAELGWFEDVILDACCQNIASSDEIWHFVVEMFERILNEMLSHLERHPRNKERRVAWLLHIEPLFNSLGLVLLAHFRRIFPLFFQWMHADDDETVLLVLKQVQTVMRLTWIRNTPHVERLVDELASLYKEAALRRSRGDIRKLVSEILVQLRRCKGLQFEAAYDKHKDDPNLTNMVLFLNERNTDTVVQ